MVVLRQFLFCKEIDKMSPLICLCKLSSSHVGFRVHKAGIEKVTLALRASQNKVQVFVKSFVVSLPARRRGLRVGGRMGGLCQSLCFVASARS